MLGFVGEEIAKTGPEGLLPKHAGFAHAASPNTDRGLIATLISAWGLCGLWDRPPATHDSRLKPQTTWQTETKEGTKAHCKGCQLALLRHLDCVADTDRLPAAPCVVEHVTAALDDHGAVLQEARCGINLPILILGFRKGERSSPPRDNRSSPLVSHIMAHPLPEPLPNPSIALRFSPKMHR